MINILENESILGVEDFELRIGGMPPSWLWELGKTMPNHAHAFFSKKTFNILGYFDNSKFGADTEYWHRLLRYIKINSNQSVFRVEELLYYAQVILLVIFIIQIIIILQIHGVVLFKVQLI